MWSYKGRKAQNSSIIVIWLKKIYFLYTFMVSSPLLACFYMEISSVIFGCIAPLRVSRDRLKFSEWVTSTIKRFPDGHKSEYTHKPNWAQLAIFSPRCHATLYVTRSQVWMGSRCVRFGVIALTLSYWSLEVQHGTSWQITLWWSEKRVVALHKDGVGYKKVARLWN